jgi:hypothetical protein
MMLSLRFTRLLSTLAVLPVVQACYSYAPLDSQSATPVGHYVALQITDRGRVGLDERLGNGVRQITGTVVTRQGNDLVVSVDRISNIDGDVDRWSGDTTRISRDFVGSMSERRISAAKTALLVGGVAVAIAVMAGSSLLGGSSEKEPPETPPNLSNRIPNKAQFSHDFQVRLWRILVP